MANKAIVRKINKQRNKTAITELNAKMLSTLIHEFATSQLPKSKNTLIVDMLIDLVCNQQRAKFLAQEAEAQNLLMRDRVMLNNAVHSYTRDIIDIIMRSSGAIKFLEKHLDEQKDGGVHYDTVIMRDKNGVEVELM